MALPLPRAFWPVTIVAAVNDAIDFQMNGVVLAATIAPGTYYSAADLCTAIAAAMNAITSTAGGGSYAAHAFWGASVVGGRVRIANTSGTATTYTLLFSTGASAVASARDVLGYGAVNAAFTSPGQTYVAAASQHQNGWYAEDPVADDTGDLPSFVRAQTRALGGHVKSVQFGDAVYDRSVSLQFLPEYKVFKALEGATHVNEALERLIESGWARFRWWPDASAEGTWTDYVLELESARKLLRDRLSPGMSRYAYPLRFLKYVSAGDPSVLPAAGFDSSLVY
jgi:hypothetical protein